METLEPPSVGIAADARCPYCRCDVLLMRSERIEPIQLDRPDEPIRASSFRLHHIATQGQVHTWVVRSFNVRRVLYLDVEDVTSKIKNTRRPWRPMLGPVVRDIAPGGSITGSDFLPAELGQGICLLVGDEEIEAGSLIEIRADGRVYPWRN